MRSWLPEFYVKLEAFVMDQQCLAQHGYPELGSAAQEELGLRLPSLCKQVQIAALPSLFQALHTVEHIKPIMAAEHMFLQVCRGVHPHWKYHIGTSALQRVVKTAQRIVSTPLPTVKDIEITWSLRKTKQIMEDSNHPALPLFIYLLSGRGTQNNSRTHSTVQKQLLP